MKIVFFDGGDDDAHYWYHYPLVNVYITMEHHHFSWENQLFLWPSIHLEITTEMGAMDGFLTI